MIRLLLVLCAAVATAAPALPGQTQERLLARIGDVAAVQSLVASPDARRIALVLNTAGGRRRVVLDSVEGREHDDVGGLCFSPDGSRHAYWAADSGRWCAVVNGVEGQRCGGIQDVCFTPDGQAAWFAIVEGRHVLVIGGQERLDLSTYGGIHEGPPVFSDDGKHQACVLCIRSCLTSRYVVVDGVRGTQPYDDIAGLRFRPGARSVVFAAKAANRWQIVTECRVDSGLMRTATDTARYDEVRGLVCSPDGRRLAYGARLGAEWFAVVDGQPFGPYRELGRPAAVFSPDSRHWACHTGSGDSVIVMLDGKRCGRYDAVGGLCFSPDGRLACGGQLGGRSFAVLDGIEGARYDGVGQFTFSPDGRHVAYVATLGDSRFVVCDSLAGPAVDAVVLEGGRLVFDGADRLRYLAWRKNGDGLDIYIVEQDLR